MTRIELLYFDGCPNHEPLLARVRELLGEHEPTATIDPVLVDSDEEAQARRFLGSPTLRVDGADVEPGADERTDFGLKCRLYRTEARLAGVPGDAWIATALESAGVSTMPPTTMLDAEPCGPASTDGHPPATAPG